MTSSPSFSERIRPHLKWLIPAGLAGLGVVLYLAFAVFGIQTLFIDDVVEEAAPTFDSGAGESGLESDEIDDDLADAMNEAMTEEDKPREEAIEETMPAMAEPEIVTVAEGAFVGRSHPAEGTAVVLNDGSAQRFLRFEDFATDNGPDLKVYLSNAEPDADASTFDDDFVLLGDLKGNIGPQNYEIPEDVDLTVHRTVVIWCQRFAVAFGAAELNPTAGAA